MAILSFLETHSVALVLLSATTMFALIIIIKIHSVRTDLDRAIRALPKNSGNSSGTNFEGLNDQIEQMAVEIVALKILCRRRQCAGATKRSHWLYRNYSRL